MPKEREVTVHLTPGLVSAENLAGGVAVVIDVLRATTTIVHALAAGCVEVRPVAEVEEARRVADHLPAGKVLLGGERDGRPLPGFDLGNSPRDYTSEVCNGRTLVLTTTNGTRALLHATAADRVVIAAFVNVSAVCELLLAEARPIHVICAGQSGQVALEDTLLAGALVDWLSDQGELGLDDGARVAWDCFANHGRVLEGALAISAGGVHLAGLGYDEDIRDAARVDRFALVPEVRREPLRIEIGTVGIGKKLWKG